VGRVRVSYYPCPTRPVAIPSDTLSMACVSGGDHHGEIPK